mmetsp:Transcript_33824/g.100925  ORF Transcript_33824/g.100925 Transcript_33824/m.100925 type:complete len:281 (+) Transcript_33824:255-1097(+)
MSSNNSGRRDVSPEHNSEPSSMASDDTTSTTGRDHDMAEAAVVAAAAAAAASNPPRNFGASTAASAQTHQPRPRRRAAAAAANNRRRRPRPGNAARDIVILNVGGTMFTTSAATLQSDSSYFKAMFSDRWANRDEDGDRGDGDGDDDDDDDDDAAAHPRRGVRILRRHPLPRAVRVGLRVHALLVRGRPIRVPRGHRPHLRVRGRDRGGMPKTLRRPSITIVLVVVVVLKDGAVERNCNESAPRTARIDVRPPRYIGDIDVQTRLDLHDGGELLQARRDS